MDRTTGIGNEVGDYRQLSLPSTSSNVGYEGSGRYSMRPSMGARGPNPALLKRIAEKRRELEALREMQAMTGDLVTIFQELESKLDVLADGTEAVALVMSNWHNVLRSISLASNGLKKYSDEDYENKQAPPLPEALVRIPVDDN